MPIIPEKLKNLLNMPAQADPRVHALQEQVQNMQGYLQEQENIAAQESNMNAVGQITTFAKEKDSSGNLKHPHLIELRETMGQLLNAGTATNLDDAYQKALRLDDNLYQQSLEAERTKIKEAEENRRKEAVSKAKKVRTSRSANPPAGSINATDLDGLIGLTLDKHGM